MQAVASRRRRRRDERREETRLLLLQAAALLFARRGYHGVSLDAVAEEAGFSKGAVYANFSSKQELLASLLEMHCDQQLAQVRTMLAEPMPLERRIEQVGAASFGSSQDAENWCLLFVELWSRAMREPGLRPRLARLHEATRDAVARMIEEEAERLGATLSMPADDVAQAVLALGDGLRMQHFVTPSERSARVYGATLRGLFRSALLFLNEETTN